MQLQERIDFLSSLLDRVDGWLRYAEAKNGALLTLTAGIMALFLRKGVNDGECHILCILWGIGIVLIIITIGILVSSFVPRMAPIQNWVSRQTQKKSREKGDSCNIIYFADIASCSKEQLRKKLSEILLSSGQEFTRIEIDLLDQIHVNAGIATRKFFTFSPAVSFFAVGSLFALLGIIAG